MPKTKPAIQISYEEKVAELNRIKAKRGYVPYHLHRAIMADPPSWKTFWLWHGGMLVVVVVILIGSLL